MSIHPLPSGSWRTQLRHKHFPYFQGVFPTREAAQAAEDAELARRQGTLSDGPKMPLRDAIKRYQESSVFLDKKPTTIRGYNRALAEVSAALGEYTLEYLGQRVGVITDYRDKRRRSISARTKKPVGPDAVRIELAALSQVFCWCLENKIFTHNPLAGVKRSKGKKRERRLESDESVNLKLLEERAKSPQYRTAARFLLIQLELFCRPGELAALPVTDIHLAERDVVFRETKNGEARTVHLTPAAVELIAAQLVEAARLDSPLLFHTRSHGGDHVAYNYAWPLRKLREDGYVNKDFVAHVMRKESISRGLESDMSPATVQLMTGQKSLQAVEAYKVALRMSDSTRDRVDQHSNSQLLEADADLNNQLPQKLALARAKRTLAALPPDVYKQLLSDLALLHGDVIQSV